MTSVAPQAEPCLDGLNFRLETCSLCQTPAGAADVLWHRAESEDLT